MSTGRKVQASHKVIKEMENIESILYSTRNIAQHNKIYIFSDFILQH